MKLSIVIPMYNIERYICECLEHLISNDSTDEYEVLIVNDGSTDESRNLVKRYIENFENFKIIDKKNGGLSSARNVGLIKARGKYIFFLDGDDFISIKEIFSMIVVSEKYDLDVLIGNGMYYFEDSSKKIRFNQGKKLESFKNITTGKDLMNFMIENSCYKIEVWDRLYKKEFLIENNLCFKEGLLHEDELFTPLVLKEANKVKYYGDINYFYRQRKGSINNSIKLKNCLDYINIADILFSLEDCDGEFKKYLNIRVLQQYLRAIQLASNLTKEEYNVFERNLKNSNFDECKELNVNNFSVKIRLLILNNFKYLYFPLYKIYKKVRFLTIGRI